MEALISGRNGLALVIDGDRLASIHAADPERMIPRTPAQLHFLAREARDFAVVENSSREQIVRRLISARDREQALQLALILQDAELPDDIRREAAQELEELLEDPSRVEGLENVLYAIPLPEQADLPGALELAREAGSPGVLALLERLAAHQDAIAEVREAWDTIPRETFGGDEELWQSVVVREGFFRNLVLKRIEGKPANDLYIEAGVHPAVRSLPNHRGVLQAWIGRFLGHSPRYSRPEAERQPAFVHEKKAAYGGRKTKRKSFDRREVLGKVETQKEEIVKAMEAGDSTRAQRFLRDLVDYQIRHGGAKYAAKSLCDLAMTAQELGQTRLQLEWTERSVKIKEDDGWAWAQYGHALLKTGRLDDAMRAYEKADFLGQPAVAKTGRAEVLKAMGRFEDALDAFNEVRQQHPDNVIAQAGRAEVLKAMGRFEEALDAYNKVRQQHPENVVAQNGRAEVLKTMGRFEDALDAYDAVRQQHPHNVVAQNGRAEVLKTMGRFEEALEAYDTVRQQNPEDAVARDGLASLLLLRGRWREALAILPGGEPASYDDWIALHIRGMISLRMDESDRAVEIFRHGADTCPWQTQKDAFRSALALAHLRNNKAQAAASLLSEVEDQELPLATRVIRVHAFGEAGDDKPAKAAHESLVREPAVDRELVNELDRRYVSRTGGSHDDLWLLQQELALLAGVMITAGLVAFARRGPRGSR